MVPPVLPGDVVLDDPALLRGRTRQEDLRGTRNPETQRHCGWCHGLGSSTLAAARDGGGRLGAAARLERPLERGGAARLEGAVVVEPAHRIAQLGPGPVEDRRAPRRDLRRRRQVGMVAEDRLAERGAQLLGRRGRLRPEHLVVVALSVCIASVEAFLRV